MELKPLHYPGSVPPVFAIIVQSHFTILAHNLDSTASKKRINGYILCGTSTFLRFYFSACFIQIHLGTVSNSVIALRSTCRLYKGPEDIIGNLLRLRLSWTILTAMGSECTGRSLADGNVVSLLAIVDWQVCWNQCGFYWSDNKCEVTLLHRQCLGASCIMQFMNKDSIHSTFHAL